MEEVKRKVAEIDGIEVIASEPGVGPHPSPYLKGKLVAFRGVTRVLLADGTDRYVCDEGDFVGAHTRAVVSHRNGTHNRSTPIGPMYPEATIRTVIREVLRAKAAKIRGYAMRAAEHLNEDGVPTIKGGPWTAAAVSGLYIQYRDVYKVRISIPVPPTPKVEKSTGVITANVVSETTVFDDVARLADHLDDAIVMLQRITNRLKVEHVTDPVLVEKARKWDEMRELMR